MPPHLGACIPVEILEQRRLNVRRVNPGFLSSAIMQFLDWYRVGKQFYLLDSFRGIDERYVSSENLASGVIEKGELAIDSGFYVVRFQSVRANVLK